MNEEPVTPINLEVGTLLQAAGVTFRINKQSNTSRMFLTAVHGGEVRECEPDDLRRAIRVGTVSVVTVSQSAPTSSVGFHLRDADIRLIESIPVFLRSELSISVMLSKRNWLALLKQHGVKSFRPDSYFAASLAEIEHKLRETCPWKDHTLYDADLTLRRNGGDVRSLLPHFHLRGGPNRHRLDKRVEQAISDALDAVAESGALRASRIHAAVTARVKQLNRSSPDEDLECPSVPTVTRRFKDRFTAYEICVRNYGKDRADKEFRQAGVRVRAERPLDVAQYDDMNTGVFMIDDRTGLPWGRGWLTSGVDECTGTALGLSMSERPRSTESALMAVIDGIFPKDHAQPEFADCAGTWDGYGHHGLITLDNASYNDTMRLQASVLDFGSEIQFARPYHPEDKTDIEHFNHRVRSEFIVNEPGWAGPKEDRDMLEHGLGTAILTKDVFARRLRRWVVDDYSNKPCGKAGKTPRQSWGEHFALLRPLLPLRRPSQELMGTVIDTLKFRASGGLLRLGLRYQSLELAHLRLRMGASAEVGIRYSLSTLEYLFVLDPYSKTYLRVPCIEDARYITGLTDYQQRLILKRARAMKLNSPGLNEMVTAREALAADTAKLATSKKMRERKLSVLLKASGLKSPGIGQQIGRGSTAHIDRLGNEDPVFVSSLEQMILDLQSDQPEADSTIDVVSLS